MEDLETRIKAFLSETYEFDYGFGPGSGYGSEAGYGDGCGFMCSRGSGHGSVFGNGDGRGSMFSGANGHGHGNSTGIKELNGYKVHIIDDMQTMITSVHDNIAQGFIINSDLTLQPCYIVKEQNHFAHGETLHDAFAALQEKLYDDSTEEERIAAFFKKFPNYDTPYPNRDLFTYHHVLTGSCRMGRESFCKDKGINLDDSTTVREFVRLTKDSYGSETIRELPQAYGVDGIDE